MTHRPAEVIRIIRQELAKHRAEQYAMGPEVPDAVDMMEKGG
jgi:hypothetical protein